MKAKIKQFQHWQAPAGMPAIHTLDCHTGGEPLRIICAGFPDLPGRTMLAKRRYCLEHYDHLRTALMFEPRGHADMYGAVITEPERADSHFGAIFMHNEGYSTMCGHAIIALATFAVEAGVVPQTGAVTRVAIDVPCGQIVARAYCQDARVKRVSFDCVPSFVLYQQQPISVPGHGEIVVDVAFGGAFYAYVNAADLGLRCQREHYQQLIHTGKAIKAAVSEQLDIRHPVEPELGFLYGTIFIEPAPCSDAVSVEMANVHSRNVCVFADGEVDRSPTGSGVSGRIAIHHARGEVALQQPLLIESLTGSRFEVSAIETLDYYGLAAVIPRVSGQAHIYSRSEFYLDPDDPLRHGFIFR